tara:strand:- start:645 stop:1319 length:675 start_codon:yes stop_codon:yes gene_type:complete
MPYGTLNTGTITPGSGNTLTINEIVDGTAIKDQNNMSSNSDTHLATQQSIKAYVDTAATQATTAAQGVGTGNDVTHNKLTATTGVLFGSDTAAANTLDDYEEGTWTPSVGGNASYTTQSGTYTKVGRMVNICLELHINVIGTGSTSIITGLPFAAEGSGRASSGAIGYFSNLAINTIALALRVDSGGTNIQNINVTSGVTSAPEGQAILGSNTRLLFGITYPSA